LPKRECVKIEKWCIFAVIAIPPQGGEVENALKNAEIGLDFQAYFY